MKSALPDFGVDPSLVLSQHQIVKDALLFFLEKSNNKTSNFEQKNVQNRIQRQSLQEVASEDVFLGL